MSLLSRLFGPSPAERLLADYADEPHVHAAPYGALAPAQRAENLAAFRESLDRRVGRFRALAAALGTELPAPDGDRARVDGIARALDALGKQHLSAVAAFEPLHRTDWRAEAPQGAARRLQTLVIDLGAYAGEVGIRCAGKYAWVTDETRYTKTTIMPTAGRVVIGHDPAVVAAPMHNHIDVIAIAAFALGHLAKNRSSKALWRPNYFTVIADLADGRQV